MKIAAIKNGQLLNIQQVKTLLMPYNSITLSIIEYTNKLDKFDKIIEEFKVLLSSNNVLTVADLEKILDEKTYTIIDLLEIDLKAVKKVFLTFIANNREKIINYMVSFGYNKEDIIEKINQCIEKNCIVCDVAVAEIFNYFKGI